MLFYIPVFDWKEAFFLVLKETLIAVQNIPTGVRCVIENSQIPPIFAFHLKKTPNASQTSKRFHLYHD